MIKNKNVFLALGMFSLSFAILIHRYLDPSPTYDFLEGMLFGLSFVFNIAFLLKIRKENKLKTNKA